MVWCIILFFFFLLKMIVWNARGVGNRPIVRHLKYLVKMHGPFVVAVIEAFIHDARGNEVMCSLGFVNFMPNSNGESKIWIFCKSTIQVDFISAFSQGLTVSLMDGFLCSKLHVTFVYASCHAQERRLLWDYMGTRSSFDHHLPWCVVGDFNIVLASSKKKGGQFPRQLCMDDM